MNPENLALRPNCLLTKFPITFITGPRSLFFHEKLGGSLQDYIGAHGYVVLSPAMPYRSKALRKSYLTHWLKAQEYKQFHFILSERTYNEFFELFQQYEGSTFTIIGKRFADSKTSPPITYRLHKLFSSALGTQVDPVNETLQDKSIEFYDRFLDHCIELAENEAI